MDFEDCFRKAYPTLYALRDKEVWVNMVGGSNQINTALLWSGCLTATPSRYYYLFQEGELLHPNQEKPRGRVERLDLSRWYELPFFSLQLGPVISDLNHTLAGGGVNVAQIEGVLQRYGMNRQFIPKLVASRLIEVDEGEECCSEGGNARLLV